METTIEKLIDFIEKQEYNYLNKEQPESCNKILNKAKELLEDEKDEIMKSFMNGMVNSLDYFDPRTDKEEYVNYYNWTYNKNVSK